MTLLIFHCSGAFYSRFILSSDVTPTQIKLLTKLHTNVISSEINKKKATHSQVFASRNGLSAFSDSFISGLTMVFCILPSVSYYYSSCCSMTTQHLQSFGLQQLELISIQGKQAAKSGIPPLGSHYVISLNACRCTMFSNDSSEKHYTAVSGVTNKLLRMFATTSAVCKICLSTLSKHDLLSTGAATCQSVFFFQIIILSNWRKIVINFGEKDQLWWIVHREFCLNFSYKRS